jgi:hypothetical protein
MLDRMSSNYASPRSPRRSLKSRLHGVAGGGIGLAAVVAILVFAAPLTSAHGIVTFTAPYNGFTATPSSYVYNSSCAHASNSVPISWNASTGVSQFAGATNAGPCHPFQYGYAEGFLSINSRLFSAPTNGVGFVDVSYSAAFSASAALHVSTSNATNSTAKGGYAAVSLYVSVEVLDVTHHNGTFLGYAYAYVVDQSFYTASGSFSLTQGWTPGYLYVSANFTAGHVYVIETGITAYILAESYGGGTTASASLNLGGANGLSISSITAY